MADCKLCREDVAEDHFCFGCRSYICEDHKEIWGTHTPEDHNQEEEE